MATYAPWSYHAFLNRLRTYAPATWTDIDLDDIPIDLLHRILSTSTSPVLDAVAAAGAAATTVSPMLASSVSPSPHLHPHIHHVHHGKENSGSPRHHPLLSSPSLLPLTPGTPVAPNFSLTPVDCAAQGWVAFLAFDKPEMRVGSQDAGGGVLRCITCSKVLTILVPLPDTTLLYSKGSDDEAFRNQVHVTKNVIAHIRVQLRNDHSPTCPWRRRSSIVVPDSPSLIPQQLSPTSNGAALPAPKKGKKSAATAAGGDSAEQSGSTVPYYKRLEGDIPYKVVTEFLKRKTKLETALRATGTAPPPTAGASTSETGATPADPDFNEKLETYAAMGWTPLSKNAANINAKTVSKDHNVKPPDLLDIATRTMGIERPVILECDACFRKIIVDTRLNIQHIARGDDGGDEAAELQQLDDLNNWKRELELEHKQYCAYIHAYRKERGAMAYQKLLKCPRQPAPTTAKKRKAAAAASSAASASTATSTKKVAVEQQSVPVPVPVAPQQLYHSHQKLPSQLVSAGARPVPVPATQQYFQSSQLPQLPQLPQFTAPAPQHHSRAQSQIKHPLVMLQSPTLTPTVSVCSPAYSPVASTMAAAAAAATTTTTNTTGMPSDISALPALSALSSFNNLDGSSTGTTVGDFPQDDGASSEDKERAERLARIREVYRRH